MFQFHLSLKGFSSSNARRALSGGQIEFGNNTKLSENDNQSNKKKLKGKGMRNIFKYKPISSEERKMIIDQVSIEQSRKFDDEKIEHTKRERLSDNEVEKVYLNRLHSLTEEEPSNSLNIKPIINRIPNIELAFDDSEDLLADSTTPPKVLHISSIPTKGNYPHSNISSIHKLIKRNSRLIKPQSIINPELKYK